jgi:SRF-type transcription factor (DNA-binding and dimerisation domain)
MDPPQIKRNNERIKRKRKNEGINRRKETLVKKAYELGEFDGIDVALIICKHGRYTIYRSKDYKTWPPSMAEIISGYSPDTWCNTSLIT